MSKFNVGDRVITTKQVVTILRTGWDRYPKGSKGIIRKVDDNKNQIRVQFSHAAILCNPDEIELIDSVPQSYIAELGYN